MKLRIGIPWKCGFDYAAGKILDTTSEVTKHQTWLEFLQNRLWFSEFSSIRINIYININENGTFPNVTLPGKTMVKRWKRSLLLTYWNCTINTSRSLWLGFIEANKRWQRFDNHDTSTLLIERFWSLRVLALQCLKCKQN